MAWQPGIVSLGGTDVTWLAGLTCNDRETHKVCSSTKQMVPAHHINRSTEHQQVPTHLSSGSCLCAGPFSVEEGCDGVARSQSLLETEFLA